MNDDTLKALTELAIQYRNERDWKQFHNPKDMAISLTLEAAELLEMTQWKSGEELMEHMGAKREHLGEELSDILYWVLVMANDLAIDLPAAFRDKLVKNAVKYPIHKAKGKARKYTEL